MKILGRKSITEKDEEGRRRSFFMMGEKLGLFMFCSGMNSKTSAKKCKSDSELLRSVLILAVAAQLQQN